MISRRARVINGDFAWASLWQSQFAVARVFGTNFNRADLRHVDFTPGSLLCCQFDAATTFSDKVFNRASIQTVDFSTSAVTSEQLKQMFGDESVTLSANITRPNHWPTEPLPDNEFMSAWAEWRNNLNDDPPFQPDANATPAP